MDEATRADRVVVMNDGAMLRDGTPEEVFSDTEMLHLVGLEAPQGVELIDTLRAHGVDVTLSGITEEECTDALFELLSRQAKK